MRIISIVGKVDARPLVYPVARAFALNGLTGIITDDGAYRRLFNGNEDVGTVSSVDIGIVSKLDDNSVEILNETGLNYDNILVVGQSYIHPDADGIIVCHGIDRSMMDLSSDEEYDDGIVVSELVSSDDENNNKDDEKLNKDKIDKANEKSNENNNKNTDGQSEDDNIENENIKNDDKVESGRDRIIQRQNDNPDKIVIPEDKKFVEVQISYAAPAKKSKVIAITLKDGLVKYMYDCEEEKQLKILPNKEIEKLYATIVSKVTDIAASEFALLMAKEEGVGAPAKKK